jgi:hypothetical protein
MVSAMLAGTPATQAVSDLEQSGEIFCGAA